MLLALPLFYIIIDVSIFFYSTLGACMLQKWKCVLIQTGENQLINLFPFFFSLIIFLVVLIFYCIDS